MLKICLLAQSAGHKTVDFRKYKTDATAYFSQCLLSLNTFLQWQLNLAAKSKKRR